LLPAWIENESHSKLTKLDEQTLEPPHAFLCEYLQRQAARLARPVDQIRVLDVGCGRGDTVAWLCREGWDAYGVDVAESYVAAGLPYFAGRGLNTDRLGVAHGGVYPFEAESFDVVISDQVFEHVSDLALLASEMARVSRPGACGLHLFPARWRPIEVHLRAPFVHWLPKGRARRAALRVLIPMHLTASYFSDHSISERVSIYATFSDTETFYRPLREIIRTVEGAGLACDSKVARDKVHYELRAVPRVALPAVAVLYETFFSVCLATTRIA
jgi:SAM-dependent methyltransferase